MFMSNRLKGRLRKALAACLTAMLMTAALSGSVVFGADYAGDQAVVKAVQEQLNGAGYDCGTPDGLFGAKTADALRRYQSDMGLPADGIISETVLAAMGLISGNAADPAETAGSAFDNASAWDGLYQLLAERGSTFYGLTALKTESEDHYTAIGILPDDSSVIYFTTHSKYGDTDASVTSDLTLGLRKNSSAADFSGSVVTDASIIGSNERGAGTVDITTLNGRTELQITQYQSESKGIDGNVNTSTNPADQTMTGALSKSVGQLLSDSAAILESAGASFKMTDLGFGSALSAEQDELADNESYYHLASDVYTIVPTDWTYTEPGKWGIYDESGTAKAVFTITVNEYQHIHQMSYDNIEKFFDSSLEGLKKTFTITSEVRDVQVGGFQGRRGQMESVSNGQQRVGLYAFFLIDDFMVNALYMRGAEESPEYDAVFDRVLGSIVVSAEELPQKDLNGGNSSQDAENGAGTAGTAGADGTEASADGNIEPVEVVTVDGSAKAVVRSWQLAPEGFTSDPKYQDKPLLMVFVDYTSLEEDGRMMQTDFWVRAYQNGVELPETPCSFNPDIVPEVANQFRSVLQGGTITVAWWWELTDTSPVTVIVYEQRNSDNKARTEFSIE